MPDHFAAFLAQVWIPVRQSPSAVVPPAWSRAWEVLRQASVLSAAEFNSFVRDCELDTGFGVPTTEDMTPHERGVVERDRSELATVSCSPPPVVPNGLPRSAGPSWYAGSGGRHGSVR